MEPDRRMVDALHGLIKVASRHLEDLTADELKILAEALKVLGEALDAHEKEESDGGRTS